MFKFIHAADIHLDSPLRGLARYEGAPVEQIRSATRRAFDNLIALAIEQKVAFVLLAGDIYDGDWKDYNTGLYFVDCMSKLKAAGIRVFIVAGNHDAASEISAKLRLPDNVHVFSNNEPEKVIVDALDVAIIGQGFAKREVKEDLSRAYPQAESARFNIGLLHTCLDGKPGHAPYAPCSLDGLISKGYHYWALGHVHTREVLNEDPWIVFPGNIQGRHVRETGAKGCTLVSVRDHKIIALEHRDVDVLRWAHCQLDISACETLDHVFEQLDRALQSELDSAEGRPVAARVTLRGASVVHKELQLQRTHLIQEFRAMANALEGAGLWLEKVSIQTHEINETALSARHDVMSGLIDSIEQIKLDDARLDTLAEAFLPLAKKLPAELKAGEQGFDPMSAALIKASLEDIKVLLEHHLLSSQASE